VNNLPTASEFGKGLVICLVKFASHFERSDWTNPLLGNFSERDKRMLKEVYNNNKEEYISFKIEIWANGASDHLYEIEVPEGKEWNSIRKKVEELRNIGLTIGNGFTGKKWKKEDFFKLQDLTYEIALMIDKKLGLKPKIGKW